MANMSLEATGVLLLQKTLVLLATAGDAHQTDENNRGMLYNVKLNPEQNHQHEKHSPQGQAPHGQVGMQAFRHIGKRADCSYADLACCLSRKANVYIMPQQALVSAF